MSLSGIYIWCHIPSQRLFMSLFGPAILFILPLSSHWISFVAYKIFFTFSFHISFVWVTQLYDNLCPLWPLNFSPSFRPQNIELGATGGASKKDSSNMEDMTVEQMTMRANQVTDEVMNHTQSLFLFLSLILSFSVSLWASIKLSIKCQDSKSQTELIVKL